MFNQAPPLNRLSDFSTDMQEWLLKILSKKVAGVHLPIYRTSKYNNPKRFGIYLEETTQLRFVSVKNCHFHCTLYLNKTT